MNSSSEDNNQISIFDVEGVDQEDQSISDYFTIDASNFAFDEWTADISLKDSWNFNFSDNTDSELTVRKNGKRIDVGSMLCELDEKLDAIIAKVEMIEQELSEDNPKLKELPDLKTLVEQKQMIDVLKSNDDE